MDRDRFSLETVIYIVVGLAFLVLFVKFYDAAFPTASLRLKVTRDEARTIAGKLLADRGFKLDGYEDATIFDADGTGAVFLQRSLGMERANALMAEKVPIWFWRCRWFRSAEKEELQVQVDPGGRLVAFRHAIEDDRKGATISQQQAEALARRLLEQTMKVDLARYERVEASTTKRANRTDHRFEWKEKGFSIDWRPGDAEAGTGTLRLAVTVQGDQIGAFDHYFKTPEAFARDYKKTSSRGKLLGIVSALLMLVTVIAALVVFIVRFKRDQIRWRFALIFASVVMGLYLLGALNMFPLLKINYPTAMDYGVFIGILIAGLVLGVVIYGSVILLTGAAGESLTRDAFPASLGTLDQLMEGRLLTRSFFFTSVRGYALAFFFLGYVTLFYIVGRRYLGVFVPAEGPYSNILGSYLPWLAPLAVSLLAAVSEEFVSRLFSISFLRRYLRWLPLALVLPAAIWAFGHSTYPVYPVYVRGIELTIGGVIFGLFFLRFNIMTCIVAHYVIDAIFIGLPLLRSGNTYYVVSGAIVCLLAALPLLLGLPGLFRRART
jgi:hypothetical protein